MASTATYCGGRIADASLRSVAAGTLAALLGAIAGHWLDLTTWQEQQHQEQMTRIYESTSDALAAVVYAMDEVVGARFDSVNAASARQSHALGDHGAESHDAALAARARYVVARRDYNTKAPGLEALLGVYFSDDVRKEFGVINDIRLPAYDAVLADSDTVAVQSQSDAVHSAVEQFDHDMARLLRRGPDLNPLDYRVEWKHSRQQVHAPERR